jgi:RecG-like helicase
MQRAALRGKGGSPSAGSRPGESPQATAHSPHLLVMTATPIPRTLALTLYGDLDISVIDEMPPGRKPVKTLWTTPSEREDAYRFVREQVSHGRQVFVICPLIDESGAGRPRRHPSTSTSPGRSSPACAWAFCTAVCGPARRTASCAPSTTPSWTYWCPPPG